MELGVLDALWELDGFLVTSSVLHWRRDVKSIIWNYPSLETAATVHYVIWSCKLPKCPLFHITSSRDLRWSSWFIPLILSLKILQYKVVNWMGTWPSILMQHSIPYSTMPTDRNLHLHVCKVSHWQLYKRKELMDPQNVTDEVLEILFCPDIK